MDKANGWMALFRIVTPAFLGVLIWIVTTNGSGQERSMERIETKLEKLSNEYLHELAGIKERLTSVETQLKLLKR